MLIYLDGFPTVFETLEKKDGVLKLNVKMIEITLKKSRNKVLGKGINMKIKLKIKKSLLFFLWCYFFVLGSKKSESWWARLFGYLVMKIGQLK